MTIMDAYDPNAPENQFPKWVTPPGAKASLLVKNYDEEATAMGHAPTDAPAPAATVSVSLAAAQPEVAAEAVAEEPAAEPEEIDPDAEHAALVDRAVSAGIAKKKAKNMSVVELLDAIEAKAKQ